MSDSDRSSQHVNDGQDAAGHRSSEQRRPLPPGGENGASDVLAAGEHVEASPRVRPDDAQGHGFPEGEPRGPIGRSAAAAEPRPDANADAAKQREAAPHVETPPPGKGVHEGERARAGAGSARDEAGSARAGAGSARAEAGSGEASARAAGAEHSRSDLQRNLTSKTTWMRLVYMLLFLVLWGVSRIVVGAVVALQFLWLLFSGETNPRLAAFGQGLASYSYELVLYLTFATDRQPFPFSDWPSGAPREH